MPSRAAQPLARPPRWQRFDRRPLQRFWRLVLLMNPPSKTSHLLHLIPDSHLQNSVHAQL
jgi:hypothetical protein